MVEDFVLRLRSKYCCDGIETCNCDASADIIEKQQEYIKAYQDQTNILLARVEALEAALREIAEDKHGWLASYELRDIAIAALAGEKEEK